MQRHFTIKLESPITSTILGSSGDNYLVFLIGSCRGYTVSVLLNHSVRDPLNLSQLSVQLWSDTAILISAFVA